MTTALAWPLDVAIAAALLADATIASLLGGDKVYSGTAPTGATFDYIVIGGTNETSTYYFNHGAGAEGALMLHLWCASADNKSTKVLFGEMKRVLDMATLAVAGFGTCFGTLTFVDVSPDPAGTYMHGIVRFQPVAIV